MKKRVLSLFMALMLCLTLLPTAALAEELEALNGTPAVSVADADAEAGAQNGGDAAGQDGEDGVSVQSGGDGIAVQAASAEKTESSVASVVIDGTTSYYDTLREAIMAAGEKAGSDGTPPTITLLQNGVELRYPQYNSAEKRDDPTYPVIVDMGGNSLSSVYFLYDTLTLTGGTVNGTWGADLRSGGSLIMTAPEDAEAAVSGPLKITNISGQVGTANVSGAKIGVKGTLRVESSAANAVVISGSEKAVELDSEAYLSSGGRFYGSTEENGSPDTVAVYDADQKTYTVNGEIVKRLVSGPKAVVAVTPGDTLSVMAGEAQEYTAQFTAEGVVSGSVKGLGDLRATVENGGANGITVNVAENAADGTWKVTVQTAESTPLGTYTLNLSSAVDGAVSGSVQFKVSETKYAASVNGTNYRSLSAAVDAAKNVNGTVTLLDNVTDSITVTDGTFTIDLNGKTWSGTSSSYALTVNGGELTVSSTGGAGTIVSSFGNKHAIWINGGTVHLKENVNLKERLFIKDENGGSVTFEPGVTVTENIMTDSHSVVHFLDGLALMDLSKTGYVPFYNRNTNSEPFSGVTVVDHPAHHMVDGVCNQCGYVCGHSNAEAKDTVCPDCGAAFIAAATAADGTVTRYTNADAALAAAAGNAKVTFVPGTYTLKNAVSFSGRIETEIDLNGATLQYASGDQGVVLQIMESYENITITLKNGTVQNTGKGTGIGLYSTTYGSTRTVLTLEDVTVIGGTNNYGEGYSVDVANRGNTLTVKSGSFSGPLYVNLTNNTVKLYGGTYQNGIKTYDKTAKDYAAMLDNSDPAKQYAYADGDGSVITYDEVATRMNDRDSTNNSIQVKEHTHTMGGTNTCTQCGFVCTAHQYKNGVCAICQAACPHTDAACNAEVWTCNACGLTMVAAVTVKDSENNDVTTYAADLPAAMSAAADNSATVTLLADVDNAGKTACVTGNDKTVTLDLAGHTITGGWIHVGKDQDNKISTSSTLKITGTGSFTTNGNLSVGESATLDLSGWTGGEISAVNMSQDKTNPDNESTLTVEAGGNQMGGSIGSLKFFSWPSNKISKTKLTCGTYGEILISMNQESSISFSDLLTEGYAFQYTDGSGFVNYGTKASCSEGIGIISNVKVVKCTAHETEGESANCIYCNADAAADAAAKVQTKDGRTVYCTDLQTAIVKAAGGGTVKLLKNVTLTESVNNANSENVTLDLNDCTITSSATVLNVWSSGMTICDSSEGGSGRICNDANERGTAVSVQGGSLTIRGGTFEARDSSGGYALCAAASGSAGSVTITGGTFKSKVDANISTTISGGAFEKNVTVYPSSSSPVVISGGNFAALETRNNTAIRTLLADGYGLKRSDGSWLTEDELTGTTAAQVTAEAPPLTSVAISVTPGTTVEYGQSVKLNLEYTTNPTGISVKHKWYSVDETDAATVIPDANDTEYTPTNLSVGEHKYRVTATADGYSKSADITITVEKIDLANATVTIDPWHADGKFRFYPYASETAALSSLSVVKVTANGKEDTLKENDYTYEGATATRVGKYTLTITAKDSCANYKGSKTFDWEVIPHQLYRPTFQGSQTYTKTYDGTTTLPGSYTWLADFYGKEGTDQNVTLKSGDYEVTAAEFVSADAGENKPINQTITLKNENFVFSPTEIVNVKGITTTDKTLTYTNFTPTEAYPTGGTTFNIEKATMPDFDKEVTLDIVNNHADTYTVDLSALLPKLESPMEYGKVTYALDTVSINGGYYDAAKGSAEVKDGKLILPIQAVETSTESNIGKVTVKVTSGNIVDFTLTINVNATNKIVPTGEPTLSATTLTYGQALSAIKLSGSMKEGDKAVPGTFAWTQPDAAPVAGEYTAEWKFTPEDTATYLETTGTVTITVNKAKPVGEPIYTKITAAKKTLADANLKPNTSWPTGTIQWVDKDGKELPADTEVKANTAYTWVFTPNDTENYNTATGKLTLYSVSTGGGGGGGGGGSTTTTTPSGTVTNPDGSTTKTETKADGTVVETTTGKDGSTTVTETKKDGSSVTESKDANGSTGTVKTDANGQTEASAKISDKAVSDAKNSGEAVKVPTEVKAGTNSNSAPTVKIDLPANSGETKIEIPVDNVNTGTVAVIVHPDGTEEIVKDSIPTENGVQLTVNGDATVKVMDNSKNFTDTAGHWSEKNIDFVSARGLLNGTSADRFSPNAPTTRAQLWTVLARQADADLTGGANWYEKAQEWSAANGISDGTNPSGTISRAQMVAMLWRAAGSPEPKAAAGRFSDVAASSYYADAVAWAVENGVTTGTKDGKFDPYASCTRAQIAAFLYRLYLSR